MISGRAAMTGDGAVGPSGRRIRVWSVSLIAGAGGAGQVILRNGTSATDTIEMEVTGSGANEGVHQDFKTGRVFPDGCFYDHDTNNSIAIISYTVDI